LVETDDELDSWVVTEELLALVRELQPDLVLMGKQTTDDDGNQVGQMLAALLDWPQATFAAKLTLSNKSLSVTRETDTGEETLAMELPAVVTTDLRLNEPRYVALPGIIKARSKPLERRGRATATKAKMRAIAYEAPPQRKAGTKVGTIDELIAAIRQTGVLS
jgi:electron transfer flavoprotein beta subunit